MKKYIYIIVGIIIYFIIVTIVLINYNINNNKKLTLVLDNDVVLQYNKKDWNVLTDYVTISNNLFDVYNNGNNIGNYYLRNENGWNLYDDDNLLKIQRNNMFMIHSNLKSKYNIINVSTDSSDDSDAIISEVLSDNNITYYPKMDVVKNFLDLDNDNENELIYYISDMFYNPYNDMPIEEADKISFTRFSFTFYVDNNEYIMIDSNIEDYYADPYSKCSNTIVTAMQLSNTKLIVLRCGYFDQLGNDYKVFEYKDNEFKLLISEHGGGEQ